MTLYNGVDLAAFVSGGVYSETYTSASNSGHSVASLFVSYGLVEDAVAESVGLPGLRDSKNFIIFKELAFEPKKRGIAWG